MKFNNRKLSKNLVDLSGPKRTPSTRTVQNSINQEQADMKVWEEASKVSPKQVEIGNAVGVKPILDYMDRKIKARSRRRFQ